MSSNSQPKRVWFDLNVGSDPSMALGLLFACKHPLIEVVGVSVSGKSQAKRVEEAYKVLEYGGADKVDVYYGEDVTREKIDAAQPTNTVVRGPLTNIARLILDEATFGRIHFVGGAFRAVNDRGISTTREQFAVADLDATRVVLTQHNDLVINALDATTALKLDQRVLDGIGNDHTFLKARFVGYQKYLREKFGKEFDYLLASDALAICDVLDTPTITREIVEFVFQPDGSFYSTTPLDDNPHPIKTLKSNSENVPVPTVKHQVIRTVNTMRIIQELLSFI